MFLLLWIVLLLNLLLFYVSFTFALATASIDTSEFSLMPTKQWSGSEIVMHFPLSFHIHAASISSRCSYLLKEVSIHPRLRLLLLNILNFFDVPAFIQYFGSWLFLLLSSSFQSRCCGRTIQFAWIKFVWIKMRRLMAFIRMSPFGIQFAFIFL